MITPKKYIYGPDKPGFVGYYLAAEVDELLEETIDNITQYLSCDSQRNFEKLKAAKDNLLKTLGQP